MKSPMDNFQFTQHVSSPPNLPQMFSQAKQNPQVFEEQFRKTNPQAYQQALQLRNCFVNPQQAVMQLAQQRGVDPNILRMLDL